MLTLIPTPLGNINDITYRAITTLQNATLILCEDTRVTKQLLKLLNERLDANIGNIDIVSFHEHNGSNRLPQIESRLESENVVYLSDAGMPCISDPGQLLVEHCQKENIEYDVLAGASVAPMLYAASGFESGKFAFYGFLPQKGRERDEELNRILANSYDTIVYEAPHRIIKFIDEICRIDEDRELFVAKELTKRYQKYYRVSAKEMRKKLESDSIKGEWAVLIKGSSSNSQKIELSQLKNLDIPPKAKAKVLAKFSDRSVKEWYEELIGS